MIIQPHITPHVVDDYDILLSNGMLFPVTIDTELGDSVDFDSSPLVIRFYLAEKPSPIDPDSKTPAEEHTIFVKHVLTITHRTREVMPATPEQQDAFRRTLHKLSSTVQ